MYESNPEIIQRNILSFFFWLASINLMEMLSYLNRALVMGDIYEFIQGLKISPFLNFPNVIIVGFGLHRFYSYEIAKMFKLLTIKSDIFRRLFILVTLPTSFSQSSPLEHNQ